MGGRRRRIAFIAMARTGGTVRVAESCEARKESLRDGEGVSGREDRWDRRRVTGRSRLEIITGENIAHSLIKLWQDLGGASRVRDR